MNLPNHILVAYDFSPPSQRALELARELRSKLRCSVEVLHVYHDPFSEMKNPPKESIWATPEQREAHVRAVGDQTRQAVDLVFGPDAQAITVRVARGEPGKAILERARETGADLVCIGSTGKGGVERFLLGSVSLHVLRYGAIPVLTVH